MEPASLGMDSATLEMEPASLGMESVWLTLSCSRCKPKVLATRSRICKQPFKTNPTQAKHEVMLEWEEKSTIHGFPLCHTWRWDSFYLCYSCCKLRRTMYSLRSHMNPANSAHMCIVYDPDRELSAAVGSCLRFHLPAPVPLRLHNGRHTGHTLDSTDFIRQIREDDSSAFRRLRCTFVLFLWGLTHSVFGQFCDVAKVAIIQRKI